MKIKDIKRMVVGIDFSIYSQRIMDYAAWAAERDLAEIVVISVINNRQIEHIKTVCANQDPGTITLNNFIDDETRRRTHNIDHLFSQSVPENISTKTIISIDVLFEEILKVVNTEDADLVVINSKDRTNFKDYTYGTTAEKIFRHSPVSVLSLNLKE